MLCGLFNQAMNSEEDELNYSAPVKADRVIRLSCYTTLSCVLLCLFSFSFLFAEKPRASVLVRGLIFLFVFSLCCLMLL